MISALFWPALTGAGCPGPCADPRSDTLEAGALEVVDSCSKPFATLSRTFDATLNFAAWDDDLALIGALRDGALGHATTVHPLLANFDEVGWARGALKTHFDNRRHRAALPKNGCYAWTIFKPETLALQELRELVEQRRVGLPLIVQEPLARATLAFDHVKKGAAGTRADPAGLTTRYDKLAANCLAFIHLAHSGYGCAVVTPAPSPDELIICAASRVASGPRTHAGR